MAALLGQFQDQLRRRFYLTNMWSSGLLFGLGDCIAQQVVEKKGLAKHDWVRTARLSAYGFVVVGTVVPTFYKGLERTIKTKNKVARSAAMVFCDQFLLTPVSLFLFFSVNGIMEGKSVPQIREKLDRSWFPTLKANWLVYIPVQSVNFTFVPVDLRLLVVNTVALGWNTYLSIINSGPSESVEIKNN